MTYLKKVMQFEKHGSGSNNAADFGSIWIRIRKPTPCTGPTRAVC
jgi:hypothetical protein